MSRLVLVLVFLVFSPLANTLLSQWNQSSGPTTSTVNAFAVSGGTVYAGTVGGIYSSTDDGRNWTNISSGLAGRSVLALLAEGSRVYAGTDQGVYVSTDMGINWSTARLSSVTFTALVQMGSRIFAGTGSGVYLSTDNGATWTESSSGLTQSNVQALTVSGSTLLAGTTYAGSIFRSTDYGASWSECKSGMTNGYVFALLASEAHLFAGTYGGVFVSTNGGDSWSASNSGLTNGYVVSLAMVGTNLLSGTNGGGIFLSTNNGKNWSSFNDSLRGRYIRALNSNATNVLAGTDANGMSSRSVHDLMFAIAPRNNSGGVASQVTFSWKRNLRALTYLFQVATDQSFTNFEVNAYTQDTSQVVTSLKPMTVYYWRVRAEHSSGASAWGGGQFTTKLTTVPQPLSPASSASLVSTTPTLSWTSLVSTASYTVQVSSRSAFDAIVFSKDTTSTSVTLSQLQRLTTYYWRVRAQTPGDTTDWSSMNSFTTLPNAPTSIRLIYPDSAKQDAYRNDWLLWQADPTGVNYLVQISQSPLFTVIYDSATVVKTGFRKQSKPFTQATTYFWRVRGSNIGGDGPFSAVWSFKVSSAVRAPVTSYSSSILDIGRVKVGQFKDTVVTISNSGNDTLRIQNISSNSSDFGARPTSRTVAPGQSFVDTIRFVPTVIGMATSSVIISSNSSTGLDTIKISGFGYGQGLASIGSSNIAMGRIKLGQFKDTTIIISNTGNDTLKITNIGSSNVVFSIRTANKTLPPGQLFVDTIRFTPTSIGTTNAAIAVSSNSPSSPDTVKVSGFGYGEATVSLSTSVIWFGSTKVWQYKDTLVTISNQGSDTLKIQSIYVYGGMFSARPFSGFVPPGKSFNDTIRFSPSTYGNMQATIVLTSNSPSALDTIRVSGVGLAAALKFNVASMDFGLVLLGKSKDTAVTVLNQGNDTLRITSITCKHPAIISTNTSLMIPPGGSAIDTFRFVPQTVGPVLGTMLFVSNGLNTYDTLRVTGSGVTATTGIVQEEIPAVFALKQNYPNPFNPSTIIGYSLPRTGNVSLRIFNSLGQEVAVLVNEQRSTGYYHVQWNANVPSGVYFYRLQAGEFVEAKKMILVK